MCPRATETDLMDFSPEVAQWSTEGKHVHDVSLNEALAKRKSQ